MKSDSLTFLVRKSSRKSDFSISIRYDVLSAPGSAVILTLPKFSRVLSIVPTPNRDTINSQVFPLLPVWLLLFL